MRLYGPAPEQPSAPISVWATAPQRIVDIRDDRLEDGIFAFLCVALPARVVGDRFGFW